MKRLLLVLPALLALAPTPSRAQGNLPQLTLQIGHVAQVTALAASPDGTLVASGAADRAVKLWNAQTGGLVLTLPHSATVLAAAFIGNDTLLTASADGVIRRWDIAAGALRSAVTGSGGTAAALSADGTLAAFALAGGKIELRQTATGTVVATLDGHPTAVTSLAFSPDGKTLASASEAYREKVADPAFARRSGDVRLWDVPGGDIQKILRGHALTVFGVAWSRDGSRLVSVGESGTAVVWNPKTFDKLNEYNISEGKGRALAAAFSADGKSLVTGWRGGVRLWALDKPGTATWTVAQGEAVGRVAALPDGRVAIGERDGSLQLLAAKDGATVAARSRVVPLACARVSPSGNFIASADAAGAVNLWDATKGSLLRAWRAHTGAVRDIAFAPDARWLATVGADRSARIWELPSGKLLRTLALRGTGTAIAVSPAGDTLAVGNSDQAVTLWNPADGKLKGTLTEASGDVRSLVYSPDGGLAAATGRGDAWGQILVWDTAGKLKTREFLHGVRRVVFSADGKRWAAGGAWLDEEEDFAPAGDRAQIWNARTGEMAQELTDKSPEAHVLDLAFGADGKTLVTASADGAIRVWESGGKLVREVRGHEGPVQTAAFTAGGTAIVSAGKDGTVRVWDAASGQLRASLLTMPEENGGAEIGAPLAPDWLATTPDGYYDSSPGAGRFVQWRMGTDVFPVEACEGVYRRPATLQAALSGAAETSTYAYAMGVPPSVSIVMPKAGQTAKSPVSVTLAATDDKDVRSVQLFINGRPVSTQAVDAAGAKPLEAGAKALEMGAKAIEMGAKGLELGAKALEMGAKPVEVGAKPAPASHRQTWTLTLPALLPPADGSGVTVKALVTDGDGLTGSDEIRLTRSGAVGAGGTLHVLSVGVSTYANPAYNLKYAGADAAAFGALWPALPKSLFQKVEVTALTDTKATSTAVRAALQQISTSAGPDDVVAIFLSGHGVQRASREFFFATTDIDVDALPTTALPWTALQEALAGSKARRIVLFLDACHSGNALGGRQAANEGMAEQLAQGAGAVVFASSLGSQQSFELDEFKHGAFTQALLEGLGKGKADLDAGAGRDGTINVEELLTFLRARIPQLTDDAQMPACPLLRDFGEPFPLARTK